MRGDQVFLTGGTGFIGAHVLDALLDSGRAVRALVRTPGRLNRHGVSEVIGDVVESGRLVDAMRGCRYLIHVAGAYSFAPRDRARMHAVNVLGTTGILEAARLAGVERAVVTSSSATVGPARGDRPATEEDHAIEAGGASAYHGSKIAAERAALAARLPAVLVLPTAPVGPADWRPTPTGAAVLGFLRGRVVASVDGGLNVVAVHDVARAHVAALEAGRPRTRYLVSGENLSFDELWSRLGSVSGRQPPRRRLPHTVALMAGYVDEARCRVVKRAQPTVPLEGVRMSRHRMFVESTRARDDLGVQPSSVDEALAGAVAWYHDHGYVAA